MAIILFNSFKSTPCTLVRMVAHELGLNLILRNLDLEKNDTLHPDYLKVSYIFLPYAA